MGHTNEPLYVVSNKPQVGSMAQRGSPGGQEDFSQYPQGTEGAKVATNNAIRSVNWAMAQAQEESKNHMVRIQELESLKSELEEQISSAQASLKSTRHELTTTQMSLKEFADRNEELFNRLASEQAAFQRLKEESLNVEEMYKELMQANQDLLDRQVNEKKIRQELSTELAVMHDEINQLELEKSKFQHHYTEMEMKLKIEQDSFNVKKEQWKEKQIKFLQKIQAEEARFHSSQQEIVGLRAQVKETVDQNDYLELQVKSRQKQLKEVSKEFHDAKQELARVQQMNADAIQKNKDLRNQVQAVTKQLQESKEEVRLMSEKVFQLMHKLKELDDWKTKASVKQLETERNVIELKRKWQSADKQFKSEKSKTTQMEKKEKDLRRTLERSHKDLAKTKSKLEKIEQKNKRLELGLMGQKSLVKERKQAEHKLNSQLASVKTSKRNQSQSIWKLERDIKRIRSKERALQTDLTNVRRDKEQLQNSLKAKDRQLEWWRTKNALFEQLKEAVASETQTTEALAQLESFESTLKSELETQGDGIEESLMRASTKKKKLSKSASASSSSSHHHHQQQPAQKLMAIRSKSRNSYAESRQHRMKLRKLLRGKSGKEFSTVLTDLKIPETDVLEWSTSPRAFFTGISTLVHRVLTEDFGSKPSSVSDQEMKLLWKRNKKLEHQLGVLEEAKTKAIMRMAILISRQGGKVDGAAHNNSGTGNLTFLTQGEDGSLISSAGSPTGGSGIGGPGSGLNMNGGTGSGNNSVNVARSENPALLQLAGNHIDDTEVGFLAESLKMNTIITEVDLKHNNISDAGLMSLVVATITDSSRVELVDMRCNRVTMQGLEILVAFLVQNMELDIITSASFAEVRGRSLVPYVRISTKTNKINFDLRSNAVFPSTFSSSQKKHFLQKLASTLAVKGGDRTETVIVAPDTVQPLDNDNLEDERQRLLDELAESGLQNSSLYSSPFAAKPSDDTILRQASHPAIVNWNKGSTVIPRPLQQYKKEMGARTGTFPGIRPASPSNNAAMFYSRLRRATTSVQGVSNRRTNSSGKSKRLKSQKSSPSIGRRGASPSSRKSSVSRKKTLGSSSSSSSTNKQNLARFSSTSTSSNRSSRSSWKSSSGAYERFPRVDKKLSLTNSRRNAW